LQEFIDFLKHPAFIATLIAWFAPQGFKVLTAIFTERRINFRRFVEMGGMPSAHSSTVSCLATCIGLIEGFSSSIFILSLTMALIIMYDAAGLRRAAGEQAEVLNRVLDDLYRDKRMKQTRLREFLGHTPIEVIIGAAVGIAIAIIVNFYKS
jgi:acid phosphatase family membrane protein YuiD